MNGSKSPSDDSRGGVMKSYLLFTQAGPILILTDYDSIEQPELADRLAAYGKFVALEVPMETIQSCYSAHFEHVLKDPKESSELIVLDREGGRIFTNINFKLLGAPAIYEPGEGLRCYPYNMLD